MTEPTWKPLITDEAGVARARAAIDDVVRALGADEPVDAAITFAYLGRDDDATAALEAAVEGLPALHHHGLWGGTTGVGWAVAHLAGGDEAEHACAVIDQAIGQRLDAPGWDGHYDLISGLVGFGVYALERLPAGGARAIAGRVLDHLEALARPADGGLSWFTPPELLPAWQRELRPRGYVNYGLAHGIPGVIALAARYVAAGVEPARARRLAEGAIGHLLAATTATPEGRFPAWDGDAAPARVAWCYGDLGVALALAWAGRACAAPAWTDEALALARACATRARDGVIDTPLCHGAAGNAHLYNRLWQATGDDAMRAAALAWIDRTFAMRSAEPIAGFPAARLDDGVTRWSPDAGILSGAAGVALALAAALADAEPLWDRLLLVDVPLA